MKPLPVGVTGRGCICAAGLSLPEVMTSLYAGRSAPAPPRRISAGIEEVYPVFEVDSSLEEVEGNASGRPMTRTMRLAMKAAVEALGEAGLDRRTLSKRRVGLALGTTIGCYLNDESFYREFRGGGDPSLESLGVFLDSNPALRMAGEFGFRGPAVTVTNACSSAADAIGLARSWVRSGRCDVALAGGADELGRSTYLGFAALMVASREACKPFDAGRRGLNAGEGAGLLVFESSASRRERGAPSLATLEGYGSSADGYHPITMDPEGRGLRRAIERALEEGEVEPSSVGFANAHGTATEDNDRIEGKVLAEIFPSSLAVVATKGYTGHTMGASGGIAAVLTVQALLDGRLPATAGFSRPDPECRVVPTVENTAVSAEYALCNSLAFGGVNSVLLFRRGA